MNEELLQFIWKHQLFNDHPLETTAGQRIEIVQPGYHNQHAGPDFLEARIRIGGTLWAGNVEVHSRSSEWYRHGHDTDKAYDNVILHVVGEYDGAVFRHDGTEIPALPLNARENIHLKYNRLLESKKWVACEESLAFVDDIVVSTWLQKMTVERLEAKVERVNEIVAATQNDWEHVCWIFMARALGTNVNAEPFQRLMQQIPIQIFFKHLDHPGQIEALLFGTSGLTDEVDGDEYANRLQREYGFLKHKYTLKSMEKHNWKMMRLRPANFPHVRMAQLAALIRCASPLFEKIKDTKNMKDIFQLLNVEIGPYWLTHSTFGHVHNKRNGKMSKQTIDLLIINAIAPVLFSYGMYMNNQELKDRAVDFLYQLPAEKNNLVRKWQERHITGTSAADSQALIHLKQAYCDKKRCLSCAIGGKIVMEA